MYGKWMKLFSLNYDNNNKLLSLIIIDSIKLLCPTCLLLNLQAVKKTIELIITHSKKYFLEVNPISGTSGNTNWKGRFEKGWILYSSYLKFSILLVPAMQA